MDYPGAEFGDFSFSRFIFIDADRQTDRITEADQRYTHATTVGVTMDCPLDFNRTACTDSVQSVPLCVMF